MSEAKRVVSDSMVGLQMPDNARYSERVVSVLGKNPSAFTGPGTNTYIVGTGRKRLLLDAGQGVPEYGELLSATLRELADAAELEAIVVTHAHIDHIGGVPQVRERYGRLDVLKMPWPGRDSVAVADVVPLVDGAVVATEGATLKAVHTPGHAPDHLCFYLVEEKALFSGDVVLGAGTTVIPDDGGDLAQYLNSLKKLLSLEIEVIYPGHGPPIRNPEQKIREYIAHRELREQQILEVLGRGRRSVSEIVAEIYTDVPPYLHAAAGSSVRAHLKKLKLEGLVAEDADEGKWRLLKA